MVDWGGKERDKKKKAQSTPYTGGASSSLDKKPGTLSGVDARAAGQAAQPLQEAKNQMRNEKMSPAQMSYALANAVNPAPAPQQYEITGSPAFNAKLAGATQMPAVQQPGVLPPGQNPNLPPMFSQQSLPAQQTAPATAVNTQTGLAQTALDKMLGVFGGQTYSDIPGNSKDVSWTSLALLGGAATGLTKVGMLATKTGTTTGIIASNTKTTKLTATWLEKVAMALGKPKIVAGLIAGSLIPIIGSYPFAGFIKEEALQQTSYTFNTAARHGDLQGMDAAIKLTDEILDPKTEEGLKNNIPFKNVIDKLSDYFEAARLNQDVNKKVFADMQKHPDMMGFVTGTGNGTVDWERVRQEQAAAEKAAVDYYNSERIRTEQEILRMREVSRAAQSAADRAAAKAQADFWLEYQAKLAELERIEREEQAKFWLEYKKLVMKMNEESRGSSLNFGLLR